MLPSFFLSLSVVALLPNAEFDVKVDGVVVELFAESPQVVTPTGIAIDRRSRVFVAESHTHFRPEDYDGPDSDRILILEDTTGDGKADQRTVFHDGFTHVMDLEFSPDHWLYVATRMDIHRMRDSTGDGVADEIMPVVTMKTTGTYPHNGISGLCFNADGTLNFGLGENLGHDYTLIGADGTKISGGGEGGSTYRVNADGKSLKRITTGWWNPFGMCVDARGRIFGTDNDPGASPPCRLIQIHSGADYGYEYRYGRTGLHPLVSWEGTLPGNIPMIAGTGEAPCGIISTERTNLPETLRDDLLVACWADHRIERFDLTQPDDAGQVTTKRHVLVQGGNDFRPVALQVAPNGDIFVTDWVSASYQLHKQGRIWRIRSNPRRSLSPQVTATPGLPPPGSVRAQISAVQKMQLPKDQQPLLLASESGDPVLCHAAIQQLSTQVKTDAFRKLLHRPSASVLLAVKRSRDASAYAASGALKEILLGNDYEAWQVAVKWIADSVLKHHSADLQAQLDRASISVRQFLMLSAALDRLDGRAPSDVPSDKVLTAIIIDESRTVALRRTALRLLSTGSKAMPLEGLLALTGHSDFQMRIEAIRKLAGRHEPEVIERLLQLSHSQIFDEQAEAIAALAPVRDRVRQELLNIVEADDAASVPALRTLAFADLTAGEVAVISELGRKNPAITEFAARATGKKKSRPGRTDIDGWLRLLEGSASPRDGERVFFHSVIGTCAKCHQHSGRGNAVGPALSLIARRLPADRIQARRWLLETILQPSKDMAPQYTPWIIVTQDGKQLTGLPRRKGGKAEAYLGIDGQEFSVKKDQIELHRESRTSIMPEGLLQNLTDQELRDLFAFLLSSR